jgi:hypothetical protein
LNGRLEEELRANRKRGKVKVGGMNCMVAGIDLGDRESLATVLSPVGDVTDRFSFPMNEEGYAYFTSRMSEAKGSNWILHD